MFKEQMNNPLYSSQLLPNCVTLQNRAGFLTMFSLFSCDSALTFVLSFLNIPLQVLGFDLVDKIICKSISTSSV